MDENLRRLIEERVRAWNHVQEINGRRDAQGNLSGEDEGTLTNALNDLEAMSIAVRNAEATVRADAEMRKITDRAPETRGGTPDADAGKRIEERADYADAFRSLMVKGEARVSPEHRALLAQTEERALGIAPASAGGALVPAGFANRLQEVQKTYSTLLDLATVIDTDTGAPLTWPTNDDTGNIGTIVSEHTAITDLDTTFGSRTINAFMYSSRSVKVSYQLLQDSAFNVEAFLGRKLGQRLGRVHNLHFTVGAGTTEPQGLITGAPVRVTLPAGNTTKFTYEGLVDLKHSIDPVYRGAARWMMNDGGVKSLAKLVDTTGRPIWTPSLLAGEPDVLLGHPITVNTDMAPPAANAKSLLFGDIGTGYLIRRVRGITRLRLNELFAQALQVGFLAFDRYDGIVDDAGALGVLVNSAT